jgi:hypothetical protein
MLTSLNAASYINQSQSFKMSQGCLIEYNMNDLIDGASITAADGVITQKRTAPASQGGYEYKPFEKLFPITSIIDPRRPKSAGIQYLILGDPSIKKLDSASSYASSKTLSKRLYFSGVKTAYKYWVTPVATVNGKPDGVPTKTLTGCILQVRYPAGKKATANKITIKFETSHSKPTSWTLKSLNLLAVEAPLYTGTTCPDNGVVNLYYNGTTWSETEFETPTAGFDLSGLDLQINSIDTAGGYLGIIEISPRYVMDVSEKVQKISFSQNASDSTSDLVPVGNVTANSLQVSLFAFDQLYTVYDKTQSFDKTKLVLYKNILVRPYVTVESEKINLGKFYLDSFTTAEYGDITLTALDGARELQYIKPPDIITKSMSSVAIIRRLLDSIGFTNYNFNSPEDDSATITPFYWYTDPNKTVWQHIQDLCQDTQMIASFDNNDVLQFYPRDYIFKNKTPQFSFRSKSNAVNLSNISTLSVENVPSVKAIKIIYNSQLSSSYIRNADPLYTSPLVTLGAAALAMGLTAASDAFGVPGDDLYAEKGVILLEPVVISGEAKQLYSYSGYLVIEKEVIEYDAIGYKYRPLGTTGVKYIWITSESEIQKYQGLAEPNTFEPSYFYRIKTRNVFNTIDLAKDPEGMTHLVEPSQYASGWTGKTLETTTGVAGNADASLFTLSQKEVTVTTTEVNGVKKVNRPHNLLNSISRSMLSVFAPDGKEVDPKPGEVGKGWAQNTLYTFVSTDADYKDSENFVMGTNMYFPLVVNPDTGIQTGMQRTIAGMAFSLDANNRSGYLLTIETTQNYKVDKNYRNVNFYKIDNGKLKPLKNSQVEEGGTIITNINGGTLYKIDIRGNFSVPEVQGGTPTNTKVLALKILINNKTFSVVDTEPPAALTNRIGLVSGAGTVAFDYVYTSPITKEDFLYNNSFDLYKGLFGGQSTLLKNFSDFVFNAGVKPASPLWIKEFGPVARELRKITTRYTSPGFPRYPSLVQNPGVTIVGSSLDSFTMETYVMNNTGVFTELANGQEKEFIVVGDYVSTSDPFEYMDPTLTDAEKAEQIGFESTWIQNESDAKALAVWMKDKWSRQQKVLTMDVFVNPLLQIGDVVQVSYPESKIYSSEDVLIPAGYSAEKFVVLSLTTTYDKDSEPTTNVICRSIYA